MDAYDGTMHFYVSDPNDPLIRAWQGIFPSLFEPMDQMANGVLQHLRVPEELFNVQTRVYGTYHVKDPLTFFNKSDRWTVPAKQTNQQSLESEAYYVVMRMPGEPKAEFLLLQPMIAGEPAEHDRVGGRAQRRPELRRRARLRLPHRHDDLRAGPDRGTDRPGPLDQRPDHRCGTRAAAPWSAATSSSCPSATRCSTSSRSTSSRPRRPCPSSRRSWWPARRRSCGVTRWARR